MNQILVLGAGKSSSHLIKYLAENTEKFSYELTILDIHIDHISKEILKKNHVKIIQTNESGLDQYKPYIQKAKITISMLPAFMHIHIAKYCLELNSHLITPSYISEEIKAIDQEVKTKNLIFLNEMGFDPGLDHMTTMKIVDEIESEGGKLIAYQSFAGGLVAKKSDDNPWNYKFSWNPRNVILAGQGGEILYKENGKIKELNYQNLFQNSESITISNGLKFDAYANRDSLKYESLYHWSHIDTIKRGTLRCEGFCEGWSELIKLGLTDNSIKLENTIGISYADFYQNFTKSAPEIYLSTLNPNIKTKLEYIGFGDSESKIELNGTAAEILQSILEKKWKLDPKDTDWVVMVHFIEYLKNGEKYQVESAISLEGEDAIYTAMSKTVGMPIAFAAIMILENKIKESGVILPVSEEIYQPVLNKLEEIGIKFSEKTTLIS